MNELGLTFSRIVLGCLFGSTLLIIIYWKRLSPAFRYLSYYIFWNLLIEILSRNYHYIDENNLPLLHLYTLGEFILFSMFYRILYAKVKWIQRYYWMFVCTISGFIILNSLFLQSIYEFNSYAKTLVQLLIMGYAIFYFYHLIDEENKNTTENGIKVINSAVLIYYSGSLFIFMFSNYFLSQNIRIHVGFWVFNAFLNMLFQILILAGLWKALRNKKFFS